jgi:hypothetical protein
MRLDTHCLNSVEKVCHILSHTSPAAPTPACEEWMCVCLCVYCMQSLICVGGSYKWFGKLQRQFAVWV